MSEHQLTVHMVGNAHIDPVWLWQTPSGEDEVINTCRTMCDLLDRYPMIRFTKGEAWGYAVVERYAPGVFQRMIDHVRSGRWVPVNGWWIQPDCNFPLAESFAKQAEIGGRYFREKLGRRVTVGYNIDSFGHTAFMPAMLAQMGMPYYVFQRPGEHEMPLPSNLFRWRAPSGETVTAFRVQPGYGTHSVVQLQQNLAALVDRFVGNAERRIGHTMCFYGVGDHGGGPTEDQIQWILEHRHYRDNVRLEFSDPERFFAAVEAAAPNATTGHGGPAAANVGDLPVVTGELQQHAIGCYSTEHSLRRKTREAEYVALQAATAEEPPTADVWKTILFNQFHDIAGGCSVRSALVDADNELGGVIAGCRNTIRRRLRVFTQELPPCDRARLVVYNPWSVEVGGPIAVEPWLDFAGVLPFDSHTLVFSLDGVPVRSQRVHPEAASTITLRFLLDVAIPPRGFRVFTLEFRPRECAPAADATTTTTTTTADVPATDALLPRRFIRRIRPDALVPDVAVVAIRDDSDTWSHGLTAYGTDGADNAGGVDPADAAGGAAASVGPHYRGRRFAPAGAWRVCETGPLRVSALNRFTLADHHECGIVDCKVAVFPDRATIELLVVLYWVGAGQVVKLQIDPPFVVGRRIDGVSGGDLERPLDGRELPIQQYCHIASATDPTQGVSIISPDIFAVDVARDGVIGATLLRTPLYAHHLPYVGRPDAEHLVQSQGMHQYRISIIAGAFDRCRIDAEVARLIEPLQTADTTNGMTTRY